MLKRVSHIAILFGAFLFPAALLSASQPSEITQDTTILYDGGLGGTPDAQGFNFVAFAASASQTFAAGVTTLDTTAVQSDQAGYFAKDQPIFNRQSGYKVQFTAQILEENHANRHRAGFSLTVLSSDLLGIELGFWSNEIWAQEGGTANIFTHAEGAVFDTTADLIEYELHISGSEYTLSTGGSEILTGALRDYTAFDGFIDPYETPNLLFWGDNTSRGQAKVDIAYAALQTTSTPTSTPSSTSTIESPPTQEPTSTPTATDTPTATATVPVTPTVLPTRPWFWWLPYTSGYPPQ